MSALRKGRARKPAAKRPRRRAWPKEARLALRWGLPVLALALTVAGGAWMAASGEASRLAEAARARAVALTAGMGLTVDNVLVQGRARASREDVLAALGAARGMPILAFDPFAAKQRLEALPWVRAATVERRLPDTIYLRLSERVPLALWQSQGRLALIDREGVAITREHLGRWHDLPLVVGEDAAPHAATMLGILGANPVVARVTTAAIRVSGRRWDLELEGGVTAHLPEDGAARAVVRLAGLIARDRILEREITAIDLRLPDRLVVRTAPGARPRSDAATGKPAGPDRDT